MLNKSHLFKINMKPENYLGLRCGFLGKAVHKPNVSENWRYVVICPPHLAWEAWKRFIGFQSIFLLNKYFTYINLVQCSQLRDTGKLYQYHRFCWESKLREWPIERPQKLVNNIAGIHVLIPRSRSIIKYYIFSFNKMISLCKEQG